MSLFEETVKVTAIKSQPLVIKGYQGLTGKVCSTSLFIDSKHMVSVHGIGISDRGSKPSHGIPYHGHLGVEFFGIIKNPRILESSYDPMDDQTHNCKIIRDILKDLVITIKKPWFNFKTFDQGKHMAKIPGTKRLIEKQMIVEIIRPVKPGNPGNHGEEKLYMTGLFKGMVEIEKQYIMGSSAKIYPTVTVLTTSNSGSVIEYESDSESYNRSWCQDDSQEEYSSVRVSESVPI